MAERFTPEEQAELTELHRHTGRRLAQILGGLDEGLNFDEIAARGGTKVSNVEINLGDLAPEAEASRRSRS